MMIDFLYFSGTHCSVCQALKPKLIEAITKSYPEVKIEVIDVNTFPDIAAQKLVLNLYGSPVCSTLGKNPKLIPWLSK